MHIACCHTLKAVVSRSRARQPVLVAAMAAEAKI